ncbi:hypothetical protein FRC10_002764 [Ceratobasidium sp. 414]|nr:hypothetical protein FRC10_002764 [Ceratobasidium sp. 414]
MLTTACVSAVACKNAPSTHPLPLVSQLRARARSQAIAYSFKQAESLAVYPSYRLYSSLPPGLTSENPKTKVEPVFASPASKKPKVELKPGPRPVNSPNPPSDGPRPATAHAGTAKSAAAGPQPVTSSTQPKVEAAKPDKTPSSPPPSKIKMAISDVVKAAEAGALTPPPKDASRLGKLWHQASRSHFKQIERKLTHFKAKELFKFYVRGLKQLLTHRQIVKDIRARIREEKAQGISSTMTWEEAHFVKTYQEDLANQRARILWKRDDAQYVARQEVRRILSAAGPLPKIIGAGVGHMPEELVTGLAKMFGLSTRGPTMLHRRRLEKHLTYLLNDDRLLVNESDMGSHLDLRNLRNAMSERGFLASADESQLRATLEKRLQALGEDAAEWKSVSLEFLLTDLLELNKDIRPTPVD